MTEMHPGDREYRNETLALQSLFVTNDMIAHVRFVGCVLTGPAVMLLVGQSAMRACDFDGDLDAILWQLQPEQERVIGATVFLDCEFYNCRFQRVGLAAPAASLEAIREGITRT